MKLIALFLALVLSGCATYTPVIDESAGIGVYERDLAECQQLARRADVGSNAAAGAAVGAIFGALLGAAIGGHDFIGAGARAGAVGGLAGGVERAAVDQRVIVTRCMERRGYAVVSP